jgi:Uma2 family endonuclease
MEVFKTLPEGTLVQLIENNLVMSPEPLDRHQVIVIEVAAALHNFIKRTKKGTVRVAPYDVYLDKKNAFQPDIIFISNERLHRIKEDGLHGAPDLVIEILSPCTAKYDLDEKKDVYARNVVTEYWIVDPSDKSTTGFYVVQDEYQEFFKGAGLIESKLLDWKLDFEAEGF